VQTRRLFAVGVIVVVVILAALLIHGCESSAAKNSLKTYNANVNTLITASDNNGAQLFKDLSSGPLNSTTVGPLQTNLDTLLNNARTQLGKAKGFSTPGQVAAAQTALVSVMTLRYQGIEQIANSIQAASNKGTSKDGVRDISVGTSQLYASDVRYKTFVTTGIAAALNGAGIPIGTGAGAQQINPGQLVTDLGWLQSTFITEKIGAPVSTTAANVNNAAPGLHGHVLNYVTEDGTQLDPTGTNTIPSSTTAPTFTLNLTNGGNFNEYQVECKVSIEGLSDTGTSTIPETTAGQTTTCSVQLPSPPPSGTYRVTAEVVPVPGETNKSNNYMTYAVTFN
jgi:CARDB